MSGQMFGLGHQLLQRLVIPSHNLFHCTNALFKDKPIKRGHKLMVIILSDLN